MHVKQLIQYMRNMQPEKVENHCSKYSDNIDILYFTVMPSQYYTAALAESDFKHLRLLIIPLRIMFKLRPMYQ